MSQAKDVYIWRDKHDANQFWIGVKASTGRYYGWMVVFCDAFLDCFGSDSWESVKELKPGCDPVPIELTMRLS